jgi:PPOX class probable F420-dependent enzyme
MTRPTYHEEPAMPEKMSIDEMRAFMMDGTRTGHLATVRRDGRAHVAPVWFVFAGAAVVFTSWHDTVKVRNIERAGRAAMSVDLSAPPYGFVTIEGPVAIDRDPASSRRWATEMGRRYMGEDRAEEFGRRNGVAGEWVFRLVPEHWAGVADMTAE